MKIYISGPLTSADPGEVAKNVESAIEAALYLMVEKGHAPFVPHLWQYSADYADANGWAIDYEDWMALDFIWLEQCDALLFLGPSPGADRERARAMEIQMPIYECVDDVPFAHAARGEYLVKITAPVECEFCGQVFRNSKGLQVHKTKKHGTRRGVINADE